MTTRPTMDIRYQPDALHPAYKTVRLQNNSGEDMPNRRIDDKLPGQPLDWDDGKSVAAEQPIPSAEDDIKTVLQDAVLQHATALLKYTNTESFALQVPDTETHIMAGPRERIAAFLGLDAGEPPTIDMWWERLGCMRNPGAFTGEESSRDDEIADLRAELARRCCAQRGDNNESNFGASAFITPEYKAAQQEKNAAASARLSALASQSQAAQPSIDHDEFWKHVIAYCKGVGNEGQALVDYVNSWHRAHLAGQSQATKVQAVPNIDAMVNRFLGWPLPKDFSPDCGISFDGRKDDEWNKNKTWPIGTNLLAATQAKAMFEHCLKDAVRPTDDHLWDATLRDRDTYQEWADKLAEAIAKHFGAEIGEHSNMNCPWHEALEVIENATGAAQEVTQQAAKAETAEQAEGAQADVLRDTLKAAKNYIEAVSEESGYGYARPSNPHHFHPDAECCGAEEIAAHKAACEAYDKGEYTPERGSEWIGSMHILRAPWGIGTYTMTDPAAVKIIADIDNLIAPTTSTVSAPGDLTTVDCVECGGSGEMFGGFGCDECDGQGKLIVSRKDMAELGISTDTVSAPDEIRNAALEEAAEVCAMWNTTRGGKLAGEIRALKRTSPNKGEAE